MKINKKLVSTAITALMILSILAIAAPASGLSAAVPANLYDSDGTAVITSARVGLQILVNGTGANPFGAIGIYWDNLGTLLNGATFADSNGVYSAKVTIPAAVNGTHFIVVQDSLGTTTSAPIDVTPRITIGIPPVRALPGDILTVTGTGFGASRLVNITFYNTTGTTPFTTTLVSSGLTTNATGSFTQTITIPNVSLSASSYTVNATDASNVTATASVTVNYYINARPSSAAPGVTITFSGRGPPTSTLTIAIDTVTIATVTTSTTGAFSASYTLPALTGLGAHTIYLYQNVVAIATTTLTVTNPPSAPVLTATSGIAGQVIGITNGTNPFSGSANITLTIGTTVVNSTTTDSRFGPTDNAGAFSTQFSVPALAPGVYTLTVTDQFGASASLPGGFTILAAPVTTISARSTTYAQGDVLSFNIYTTEPTLGTITVTIKDPAGQVWWTAMSGVTNAWSLSTAADGSKYVAYQNQTIDAFNQIHIQFPADAPTGSWNWTITYTPTSTGVLATATGLVTVVAGGTAGITTTVNGLNATLTTILNNLNAVGTNVTSIKGSVATIQTTTGTIQTTLQALNATIIAINGNTATLSTSIGTITTSINSMQSTVSSMSSTVSGLSGTVTSISSGVATLQTTLGTVTTSLSSLDAVLGAVAGDTTTIKTSLGTITTSLSSIGTTVTKIDGGVATIQTDLGTLSGTVTSISGNIATIQTSLGTMQADISALQTDVTSTKSTSESLSPLIIVAIVLALVAAIAAIASIVLMRKKIAG